MIMRTSAELKQFLYGQGAGLVGIGNMEGIENCRFQTGVAIAVPLPPRAVAALREAPTLEYLDLYHALNQKLDEIVLAGERFLQNAGHNALAQTTTSRWYAPAAGPAACAWSSVLRARCGGRCGRPVWSGSRSWTWRPAARSRWRSCPAVPASRRTCAGSALRSVHIPGGT